jgi:serine/threonine protein phosphatase PrpC
MPRIFEGAARAAKSFKGTLQETLGFGTPNKGESLPQTSGPKTVEAEDAMPDVVILKKIETAEQENPFVTETAEICVDAEPGKGEDRILSYDDGKIETHAVFDGMGGQKGGGGGVAADIVRKSFLEEVKKMGKDVLSKSDDEIRSLLKEAGTKAGEALQKDEKKEKYPNMGTTMTAMVRVGDVLYTVSTGDSRVYRMRDSKLDRLSEEDSAFSIFKSYGYDINTDVLSITAPDGTKHDVTLGEALDNTKRTTSEGDTEESIKEQEKVVATARSKSGHLTLKSLRNMIVGSGGFVASAAKSPYIHVDSYRINDGDEFFAATDGLTDNISDKNLHQELSEMSDLDPEEKLERLVRNAKKRADKSINPDANGEDDTTIVYFKAKKKAEEQRLQKVGT